MKNKNYFTPEGYINHFYSSFTPTLPPGFRKAECCGNCIHKAYRKSASPGLECTLYKHLPPPNCVCDRFDGGIK